MPQENVENLDQESSLRQNSSVFSMSPSRRSKVVKTSVEQESIVEELSDYEGVDN